MAALESGEIPPEPFVFLEGDKEVNAQKLIMLMTDPFHMDLNNKKTLSALYALLEKNLSSDVEKRHEWEKLVIQANRITEQLTRDLFTDVYSGDGLTFGSFLKESGVRFDYSPDMGFKERMLRLMDVTAELMPQKLIVCCNIFGYCEDDAWYELMKYACYLKIRLLDIEQDLPEKLYRHEIRWVIHSNFDDEIRKGW